MGKKEKKVTNNYLLNLNPETERAFRINAGSGWVGPQKNTNIKRGKDGSIIVTIIKARRLNAAPIGWPDIVGWKTLEVALPCCGSCGNRQIEEMPIKCGDFFDNGENLHYWCEKYEPWKPKKIAQFVAREVKATGTLSKEQRDIKNTMESMGVDYDILTE